MTTPADELRTAAAKLRTLVSDATEGPWASEDPNKQWGDDHERRLVGGGKILATFNNDHNGPLNADYAAAMHPGIGALLVKWLASWQGIDFSEAAALPEDAQHALAIARAINGSQPTSTPCPTCGRPVVVLGETGGEIALMCGYCTYNCTVLADGSQP